MSPQNEIVITGEDVIVHRGKFLSQAVRSYRGTDGELKKYEMTVRNNAHRIVSGLPITKNGDFLINRQFRIPLGRYVYENTAGLVDAWESKEEAMQRELREETGYASDTLIHVCQVPTSSGLTNELVDCFLLLDAEKVGEPMPEPSESIETLIIQKDEIDRWFIEESRAGSLIDPKIMMLVWYYRLRIASI